MTEKEPWAESRSTGSTASASFAALFDNTRAFEAWYEDALPRVVGFVHIRTGGDLTLTEEITAQAFFEAVRARRSFGGRSDPVTWICSIARNRLVDHYRRQAREQARHLRLVVGSLSDAVPDEAEIVDDREAVIRALSALPDLERTVLTLRYLDGYSVREIAGLIGRTERATDSILWRARERVRSAHPGGLG
ncbi:MAG: RNA polymerase sigma factor [Chloroflexi bacterium]|nr:RNA polymerase sigma factor [Chloroflexota bacterium]